MVFVGGKELKLDAKTKHRLEKMIDPESKITKDYLNRFYGVRGYTSIYLMATDSSSELGMFYQQVADVCHLLGIKSVADIGYSGIPFSALFACHLGIDYIPIYGDKIVCADTKDREILKLYNEEFGSNDQYPHYNCGVDITDYINLPVEERAELLICSDINAFANIHTLVLYLGDTEESQLFWGGHKYIMCRMFGNAISKSILGRYGFSEIAKFMIPLLDDGEHPNYRYWPEFSVRLYQNNRLEGDGGITKEYFYMKMTESTRIQKVMTDGSSAMSTVLFPLNMFYSFAQINNALYTRIYIGIPDRSVKNLYSKFYAAVSIAMQDLLCKDNTENDTEQNDDQKIRIKNVPPFKMMYFPEDLAAMILRYGYGASISNIATTMSIHYGSTVYNVKHYNRMRAKYAQSIVKQLEIEQDGFIKSIEGNIMDTLIESYPMIFSPSVMKVCKNIGIRTIREFLEYPDLETQPEITPRTIATVYGRIHVFFGINTSKYFTSKGY